MEGEQCGTEPNKHDQKGHGDTMQKSRTSRLTGGMFITSLAGMSLLFGFGMTVALAKKKDPSLFNKSLIGGSKDIPESGATLALKALGWGTLYSVTGTSLIALAFWKLCGVNNMTEFREKIQRILPFAPQKTTDPPGRSEFKSIRELVNYLIDEDKKHEKDRHKT